MALSLTGGSSYEASKGFATLGVPDKMRWADNDSLLFLAGTTSLDWNLMRVPRTSGTPRVEYDPRKAATATNWDQTPSSLDVSKDNTRVVLAGDVRPRVELWSFDITSALNGK